MLVHLKVFRWSFPEPEAVSATPCDASAAGVAANTVQVTGITELLQGSLWSSLGFVEFGA